MLKYNFKPSLLDHCQVLMIVRPVSKVGDEDFGYILRTLKQHFQFVKLSGTSRILRLKFIRAYPKENISWGSMQLHRKPAGLIGIGKLSKDVSCHQEEMKQISTQFDNMKSAYLSRIDEFKCLVIGPQESTLRLARSDQLLLKGVPVDVTNESELCAFMNELISYVFIGLESKRVEKTNEKLERMQIPTAPTEQEQMVSESDSRFTRRKCLGRNKKLLADICLMSAMYQEAMYYYANAAEHLRAVNDYLWMGAALEGVCAATVVMTKIDTPHADSILCELTSKTSNGCQIDPAEFAKMKSFTPLSNDELVLKYQEVLGCYRRFTPGLIEIEAHLKFAEILSEMKKKLETCQVFHSLLPLSKGFNENEKIELYKVIASFYDQLHLPRKAAFFKWLASERCFKSPTTNMTDLAKANNLLELACPGYSLDLSSRRRPESMMLNGWASVQMNVLLDLLHISRKLGNTINSIRIICYLLEAYQGVLSENGVADLVSLLEDFSSKELATEDVTVKDPVGQTSLIWSLPKFRDVRPRQPPHYLRPIKSFLKSPEYGGPFIFSSLSFQTKAKGKDDLEDVKWVCNELSEVGMTVDNPLPAEIKVDRMKLLTEGINFNESEGKLALPAKSGSFPFMLLGTPTEPGKLVLRGFEVEVFGIKNDVYFEKPITVDVTYPLPLMQLSSNLNTLFVHTKHEDADYRSLFTSISLYRGHSFNAEVKLENCGVIPITEVFVKLDKERDSVISFSQESLNNQLPIQPGSSAFLSIHLMPSSAWKLSAKAESIRATLTFNYSGGNNGPEEFGREIAMVVEIKVMASLNVTNFDVYKFDRHTSCCCLCFDAQNLTSVAIHMSAVIKDTQDIKHLRECSSTIEVDIPAKEMVRVGLHSPRFSLKPPEQRRREKLEDMYAKAIVEAVDIKWHVFDSDYSGVSYLDGVNVTKDMIKVLKPEHLSMDLSMDNEKLEEGTRIEMKVFGMTCIQVQLRNMHDYDLENLLLSVRAYPEHRHLSDVSPQLVAWHGVHTKAIKRLSPGESFEHSCGLMFLFNGHFQIDVSCSVERHISGGVLRRSRAQAIISDKSLTELVSIEAPESEYVVIDGVITQPKTHEDIMESKLQKPISNYWVQSLRVLVR